MKPNHFIVCSAAFLVALLLLLGVPGAAQVSEKPLEGIDSGNYNIKQTAEFGYRFTSTAGNRSMYNTFVNLNPGPRLLDYTLEMRSLNHAGWLFDSFYLTNFGYGGDPNNVTRLRAYKNKWYNFSGTFRRDRNFWDYNLLANPLNPLPTFTVAPPGFSPLITFSPHHMEVTRRMSDFNLTLMPQSRVRFRVGYTRNISEGPSFTSFHEGTDVLLFQPWKTTLNSYQFGVDFKFLPRTNISYDQFFHHYKGDPSWVLNARPFQLSDGTPVDLGLPLNPPPANQPCAAPFIAPVPPSTVFTVNPACNGYLAYNRNGRVRTDYPTEQISFQSSYFKNVDFSGRFTYSASDNDVLGFDEFFRGLVTRTRQRQFSENGTPRGRRISVTADWAMTAHINEKFRIVHTFRFSNFRLPGSLDFQECSFFGTSMLVAPRVFTSGLPLAGRCPPPSATSPGSPAHSASSPADIIVGLNSRFLGQDSKVNTIEAEYDFNRRIGGRLGYRYGRRRILHREATAEVLLFFPSLANRGACAGATLPPECVLQADGSILADTLDSEEDETVINEHSALIGFWTRPVDEVRISLDVELLSADNTLTRISPRQSQRYKSRLTYKPVNWMSWGASLNILERRNNVDQVFHKQHSRSYGVSLVMDPKEWIGFDVGYDYNDIFSHTNICYTLGFGPLPPGSTPCPVVGSPSPISGISHYTNRTEFGYGDIRVKPFKRLTTNLGFAISNVSGETTFLAPTAPPGPLQFTYYRPYAGFALEMYRGLSWKGSWGFYEYNEKAPPDPFSTSRDFRVHTVTLGVRYAF